jgi:replicative superfamily II helicase
LGLSAASQGADDVSQWLTGTDAIAGANRPTGTLEIVWETDGTLKQRVDPRPTTVAELNRRAPSDDAAALIVRLIPRYSPVLAVEPMRQWAESLSKKVVKLSEVEGLEWRDSLSEAQSHALNAAIEEVKALLGDGHPLAQYMEMGVAFHHAGVPTQVRQQVEHLASEGLMRVVCATTTVAEGADLPFKAVVLPHLNFPGATGRLDRDLYQNIIGRAGRATYPSKDLYLFWILMLRR